MEINAPSGMKVNRRLHRPLDNFYTRKKLLGILLVIPTVLFLLAFIVYPVIMNIVLSFTNASLMKDTHKIVWFKNYIKLFSDVNFPRYLKNTLIWTFFSVIGQLALGLGFALLILKNRRGGTLLRSFLLIPYVVPGVAIALMTRWLCNSNYGLISYWLQQIGNISPGQSPLAMPGYAMAVVIIVNIWRSYPFPMLIYWAALKGIDHDLYEAASIDGAGKFKSFLHITLPQLRNTTLVLAILRIAWTATYFDLIWMITCGGPAGTTTHLPIMIYQASFGTFQTGYGSAVAVILGILLLFFVIFYVKESGDFAD